MKQISLYPLWWGKVMDSMYVGVPTELNDKGEWTGGKDADRRMNGFRNEYVRRRLYHLYLTEKWKHDGKEPEQRFYFPEYGSWQEEVAAIFNAAYWGRREYEILTGKEKIEFYARPNNKWIEQLAWVFENLDMPVQRLAAGAGRLKYDKEEYDGRYKKYKESRRRIQRA